MNDARSEILSRIRRGGTSAGGRKAFPGTNGAAMEPSAPTPELIALFCRRVADYGAGVWEATPGNLAEVVALAAGREGRVVVAPGADARWLDEFGEVVVDGAAMSHRDLELFDAVVTGCRVAIAETGTVVLDGGPGQGRRAVSLLPDHHVVVVREAQIVLDVPQALARLDPARALTWISGPSATSDIELSRVQGVHGPRRLDVVVVSDGEPPGSGA